MSTTRQLMKVYKVTFNVNCGLLDVIVVASTPAEARHISEALAQEILYWPAKVMNCYELDLYTNETTPKVVTHSCYEE